MTSVWTVLLARRAAAGVALSCTSWREAGAFFSSVTWLVKPMIADGRKGWCGVSRACRPGSLSTILLGLLHGSFMVAPIGPLATLGSEPRQARKGATVVADACAGVWLVGAASMTLHTRHAARFPESAPIR